MNVFLVYYRDANSYNSTPKFPIRAFENEDDAIAFAKEQQGYGYNVDWFVKPVPLTRAQ